jgi:hypothetical protein
LAAAFGKLTTKQLRRRGLNALGFLKCALPERSGRQAFRCIDADRHLAPDGWSLGGHQRNPEWHLDEPANRANNTAPHCSSARVVTTLSQLGANQWSRPETARDGLGWSAPIESHCKTVKFVPCPTGGQGRAVVAAVSWWNGYRKAGGYRLFTTNDWEPTGIARFSIGGSR